jgi:hypothetical protein
VSIAEKFEVPILDQRTGLACYGSKTVSKISILLSSLMFLYTISLYFFQFIWIHVEKQQEGALSLAKSRF